MLADFRMQVFSRDVHKTLNRTTKFWSSEDVAVDDDLLSTQRIKDMSNLVLICLIPFVFSQLYTQPIVYYQYPYTAASSDQQQYVYSPSNLVYQHVPYQPTLGQTGYGLQGLQTQYLQQPYLPLQYSTYQRGLGGIGGLGGLGQLGPLEQLGQAHHQNILAKELAAGYLNEFRDSSGALHRSGAGDNEPLSIVEHASYMSLINDKDNFQVNSKFYKLSKTVGIFLANLVESLQIESAPYRYGDAGSMMGYGSYGSMGGMGGMGGMGSPYGMSSPYGMYGMGMSPYGMGMPGMGMGGMSGMGGLGGYGSPYSPGGLYGGGGLGGLGSGLGMGLGTSSYFKK
ncbi:unnamed protein product [Cylicocyclus nassatus]|uniref:Uncharacterized protein n=1 Tax=Cylicocyclus nassatus TaxID=53992 RepID=A0AA36DKK9_CYLNA|nr:unnamed protein product [Cylicocyclus nassatus]